MNESAFLIGSMLFAIGLGLAALGLYAKNRRNAKTRNHPKAN